MRQVKVGSWALGLALAIAAAGCATGTRAEAKETEHRSGTGTEASKGKKANKKKAKKARKKATPGTVYEGKAVWYGGKHHGGPTASGERFDKHAMTAAHRDLPFGTRVRVTNKANGKSVVVRINDRGPFGKDRTRIIDVSEAAARKLDFLERGVVPVTVEVLE